MESMRRSFFADYPCRWTAAGLDGAAVLRAVPAIRARWAAHLPPESARLRPRGALFSPRFWGIGADSQVWEALSPRFSPLYAKGFHLHGLLKLVYARRSVQFEKRRRGHVGG